MLPPPFANVPIFTPLDLEFLQLSDEAARLFDAAADGALGSENGGGGGSGGGRAALFSLKQLVVVEVAGRDEPPSLPPLPLPHPRSTTSRSTSTGCPTPRPTAEEATEAEAEAARRGTGASPRRF